MSPTIEYQRLATNVGELHVEVRGRGPAIFCWPSLYCDARTLEPLIHELERDHLVIVVEGPAHGRSGNSPGPFSLNDCADAAMTILDVLGIRQVTWIGVAWGGHVGVAAAVRHAPRLAGLIVLNAPMASWHGKRLALIRLSYALLRLFGSRSFVASLIADKMIATTAGPDRRKLVDAIAGALRRCDPKGIMVSARSEIFERGDLVPSLPAIRVPTVFFAGDNDALFPVEEARQQAALIPGCRFVVVERSSHQSVLEAPEQVLPVIREMLASWGETAQPKAVMEQAPTA